MSGEVWRMRDNELAKEELRRERKRAIESGELKGRRLFEEETEMSFSGSDEIMGFCSPICGDFDERETEDRLLSLGGLEKTDQERERESVVMEDDVKGKKIFEAESDMGFEEKCEIHSVCGSISGECDGIERGKEAQGMLCFNGRCFCSEKTEQGEGDMVVVGEEVSEEERIEERRKPGYGSGNEGRLLPVKLCFVVVFVAFVFGIFGGLYGFESGENVVLIPT